MQNFYWRIIQGRNVQGRIYLKAERHFSLNPLHLTFAYCEKTSPSYGTYTYVLYAQKISYWKKKISNIEKKILQTA
jgi:hypothetical protein